MLRWQLVLALGLPTAAFIIVLFVAIYNLFCCYNAENHHGPGPQSGARQNHVSTYSSSQGSLFSKFPKNRRDPTDAAFRHSSKVASVWRVTYPTKPFDWSEHPGLVAEAVEHGWSAFAFAYVCSSCYNPVNLWDMCTLCSQKRQYEPDIAWEVSGGSEYMQKLRLNPGLMPRKENEIVVQALQAALPLPGPSLGPLSFPQEAYFEITVLAEGYENNKEAPRSSFAENEPTKLMSRHLLSGECLSSEVSANESLDAHGKQALSKEMSKSSKLAETLQYLSRHTEFSKFSSKENHTVDSMQAIAVGLAPGGAPPFRFPGFDRGSVGFHSNGLVYVNGIVHIDQEPRISAATQSWGAGKRTVGCGFNPLSKKVFFTLDGAIVHDLVASSVEFGHPLFPTIAANHDVKLLVNFGQSSFDYSPADSCRVSDPCFRRPYLRSAKINSVNEDSGDLFSMGRIDSQWFTGFQSPGADDLQHRHGFSEAESDLFEIVLEPRVT